MNSSIARKLAQAQAEHDLVTRFRAYVEQLTDAERASLSPSPTALVDDFIRYEEVKL